MVKELSDRELLARVLQAEAGSEGPLGKLAVGAVIQNRVQEGAYGKGLRGVIMRRGHFSPLNLETDYADGEQGVDFSSIRPTKETYAVTDAILTGEYDDPTGGASHFYNPDFSNPKWGIKGGGNWMTIGRHVFGRADAGRDKYVPPRSEATPEARRRQYALGDSDPGTMAQVLQAVQSGAMTKAEAARYVSEDLLEGIEGGSAYDLLQDRRADEAQGMAMLGEGLQMLDTPQNEAPTLRALPMRLSPGRPSATPGTQAIGRFGLESLLGGNPLLGIR